MNKGIVLALAVSGSLLAGPAALAAPAGATGSLPGYRLEHAGHDHGPEPDRRGPKADHCDCHDHGQGHGHGDGHRHGRHDDDSAHASGGYDSHRHHPRDW
jgi:hypothetical protein